MTGWGIEGTASVMVNSNTSPQTLALNSSGSNRLCLVLLQTNYSISDPNFAVTYSGVSMTLGQTKNLASSAYTSSIFYLAAPATGTNNISVSWTTGTVNSLNIAGIILSGASQSAPNTGNGATISAASAISTSLSPTALKCFVIDGVASTAGTDLVQAASNQTSLCENNGTFIRGSVSYFWIPSNNPTTIGWTSGATSGAQAAVAIAPAGGNGLQTNNLRPRVFAPGLAR